MSKQSPPQCSRWAWLRTTSTSIRAIRCIESHQASTVSRRHGVIFLFLSRLHVKRLKIVCKSRIVKRQSDGISKGSALGHIYVTSHVSFQSCGRLFDRHAAVHKGLKMLFSAKPERLSDIWSLQVTALQFGVRQKIKTELVAQVSYRPDLEKLQPRDILIWPALIWRDYTW